MLDGGSNGTITCSVTGGIRDVKWKRNGQTIAHSNGTIVDSRYAVLSCGSLHIASVSVQDSGIYNCIVSNRAGRDMKQVEVKVEQKVNTRQ